ncbi:Dual specificity phosphatase, catalytic domain containing protein [Novymonas esmeraldas]|uniref:Dual specificity phosphatase, catalytic domain containing protein n=1 Tax=Novymonas esmeraldas TaxID=1808958 RepID=A0AAW0F5K8_9TRYP
MASSSSAAEADPFTREEETRLSLLSHRAETADGLTESESLELAQLKRRYHTFLEEGERRLREAAPGRLHSSGGGATALGGDEDRGTSAALSRAGKAAYFWGSLVATALPGYVGRVTGVTSDFLHWNWIAEHIVLGAIPVVTQVGSGGDHLSQLRSQLEVRHQTLGLVVACLEEEELNGFGMNMIQFAKEAEWRSFVNPRVEYVHVPMADTTAGTPLPPVAVAVSQMEACIKQRGETVYVHCKAGKGRSWMVTMCYLTTCGGMSFEAAAELIRERRVQVNPSSSQRSFAEQFPYRFAQWRSLQDRAGTDTHTPSVPPPPHTT